MRGRSYFLKTCYRTVKEIAHMANLDKKKEIKDRKLVYVGWLEQVKN